MTDSELQRARRALDRAIRESQERRAAETADHAITMARMRTAAPDDALLIARDYAIRRGFMETLKQIEALIAEDPK